jgi:uncharacterized membrane protein YbhN (UPF0104 family)
LATLVGISALGVLIWYASPARLLEVLRQTRPDFVALSWGITFLATAFRTWRYALFLPVSGKVRVAYGVFSLSRLLNLTLPFRTGEIVVLALLKRTGLAPTIAESIPVWAALRIGDVVALSAWFCVIAGIGVLGHQYEVIGWTALGLALGALAVLFFGARWLRLDVRLDGWIGGRVSAVVAGFKFLGAARRQVGALGLSLLLWATLLLSMVVAQFALNTPLAATDMAVVAVIALSASVLPINAPLGIGTGDAVWAVVLALFGVPGPQAIAIALGIRLILLSAVSLEALVGTWLVRQSGYSLRKLLVRTSEDQVTPRR